MKTYTQAEFDEFPVIDGIRQCPTGNYTQIKRFGERCSFGGRCRFSEGCSFGEWCSFGERCRFGERCSFGEGCSFGERCSFGKRCSFEKLAMEHRPYFIRINNIGSRQDGCIIYNAASGLHVRSGCWFGTESEFIARVKDTHEDSKYVRQYLAAIELARITFGEGENE